MARAEDLRRIEAALERRGRSWLGFTPGEVEQRRQGRRRPGDRGRPRGQRRCCESACRAAGEGWLSEETVDDPARLECCARLGRRPARRDPGVRRRASPSGASRSAWSRTARRSRAASSTRRRGQRFVGAVGHGVTLERQARAGERRDDARPGRGPGQPQRGQARRVGAFRRAPFTVEPTGSVAYKMAWWRPVWPTRPGRWCPSTSGTSPQASHSRWLRAASCAHLRGTRPGSTARRRSSRA